MKQYKGSSKAFPLVKRSDAIRQEHVGSKGMRVESGRGLVQVKPTREMVGRKYGELVKTRTTARKRVVGKGKGPVKPLAKKPTNKK
jgi:ribosomal protein S19